MKPSDSIYKTFDQIMANQSNDVHADRILTDCVIRFLDEQAEANPSNTTEDGSK